MSNTTPPPYDTLKNILDTTASAVNESDNIIISQHAILIIKKTKITKKHINLISCYYYNPQLKRCWKLDKRLVADETETNKLHIIQEILDAILLEAYLPIETVLFDTYCGLAQTLQYIHDQNLKFYGFMHADTLVNHIGEQGHYSSLQTFDWSSTSSSQGTQLHLHNTRLDFRVQLYQHALEQQDFIYIVSNGLVHHEVSEAVAEEKQEEKQRGKQATTPTEITIGEADEFIDIIMTEIREHQKEFAAHDESTQKEKTSNEQDLLNASSAQGSQRHPLLNSQQLAGESDVNATPIADQNPEARQKLENALRQKLQLNQQLQAQHGQMISPRRGG